MTLFVYLRDLPDCDNIVVCLTSTQTFTTKVLKV